MQTSLKNHYSIIPIRKVLNFPEEEKKEWEIGFIHILEYYSTRRMNYL